ncbi:hypothetical protein GF406_03725 [candidate division KSB1 bacterium]|nr:hypothetical protein [candidate division KSB1 bacterium]
MKTLLKIISYAGLALTVTPSFLVFLGTIDLSTHKTLMLVGTLMWFLTVPFWMGEEKETG